MRRIRNLYFQSTNWAVATGAAASRQGRSGVDGLAVDDSFNFAERRRGSRFRREPKTEYALILHPSGEEVLAEVHDESLEGLGLRLQDCSGFSLGCEVTILYGRERLRGIVRHFELQPAGDYRIGFECFAM